MSVQLVQNGLDAITKFISINGVSRQFKGSRSPNYAAQGKMKISHLHFLESNFYFASQRLRRRAVLHLLDWKSTYDT